MESTSMYMQIHSGIRTTSFFNQFCLPFMVFSYWAKFIYWLNQNQCDHFFLQIIFGPKCIIGYVCISETNSCHLFLVDHFFWTNVSFSSFKWTTVIWKLCIGSERSGFVTTAAREAERRQVTLSWSNGNPELEKLRLR